MVTTYVSRVLSVRAWVIALLVALTGLALVACGSTASTNVVVPSATKCQVTLSNSAPEVPSSGGNGTLSVNSERDCSWSASATANWIALGSTSGQGSAKIDYSVQPNPNGTSRTARVVVSDQSIDVLQAAAPCTFVIDPQTAAVSASTTTVAFSLTATPGCQWTAKSGVDWIGSPSPSSGTGSATVHFTVSANPGDTRTGPITIGDAQGTVQQAGTATPGPPQPPTTPQPPAPPPPGCTITVSPSSVPVSDAGGDVQVDVTAPVGCSWVSFSNVPWIAIKSGVTGSGNGAVVVTVSANPGAARSATFSVGGVGVTIDQAAASPAPSCTYQLTPPSTAITGDPQDVSVSMATASACKWTVTSNALWITVADPGPGAGSGAFRVTVAANTGAARTGTVTAGTATFTVNQAAAVTCTYAINPSSYSAVIGADAVDVNVAAGGGCPWSASTPVSWITIATGASGTGPGTVHLTIDPNPGAPRSASLTIANQPFVVNQQGTCTYSIKPTYYDAGKGPDNITIDVTAPAGCTWTATSPVSWVTVTQGATGTGNGQVKLAVDPNSGPDRAATLTIAGQPFQLTQKGH